MLRRDNGFAVAHLLLCSTRHYTTAAYMQSCAQESRNTGTQEQKVSRSNPEADKARHRPRGAQHFWHLASNTNGSEDNKQTFSVSMKAAAVVPDNKCPAMLLQQA